MSFTLNLGFGGLCLMVHDEANAQMHVLLPACAHHDLHLPVLVYDQGAPTGSAATGIPVVVDLPNTEIDLTGVSDAPALETPPTEVADLTSLFDARVPRALLTDADTAGLVNARIRFASGASRIAPGGAGDVWYFPDPEPAQLPIRVIWSLQIDAPSIDVGITGINGFAAGRTVTLKPHGDTLDLWVFNSPAEQIPETLPPVTRPDQPEPRTAAEHFGCLYHLTGSDGLPLPLYWHRADRAMLDRGKVGNPGLDVMCIAAQALPKP